MAQPLAPIPVLPRTHFNLDAVLLFAGLLTALVTIMAGLVARFLPAWHTGYLETACFLICLEAALIQYRMRQGQHLAIGALNYLGAELFALAVLMRLVASLSLDGPDWLEQLRHWLRAPLDALDGPFMVCLAVGLGAGLLVRAGMGELGRLEPLGSPPSLDHSLDAEFYNSMLDQRQRYAVRRLSAGIAWGGALILLALAAHVANLAQFGGPPLVLRPAVGFAGVAYLVCGALLYSRARLGLLRSRWHREGATVEPAVVRSWRRVSSGIVLVVALLTLLLPRSYGLGLLDLGRSGALILVNLVGLIAVFFGLIAMGALSLLVTIPLLLLMLSGLLSSRPAATPAPPLPPVGLPQSPTTPPVDPALLPGVIFWICMALLAGYAIWIVLRRQAWAVALVQRLRAGLLGRIYAWFVAFWARMWGYATQFQASLAERRRPAPPGTQVPQRSLRLSRLTPTELIRYFYVSTLRRADKRGLGREPAQTPYEYGAFLRNELPDATADIDRLTDSYVQTAYAPRPASAEEAARARGPWERLRRLLRRYPG